MSKLEWWKDRRGVWFYGVRAKATVVVFAAIHKSNELFDYQLYVTTAGLQEARYKTLEAAKFAAELLV